MTDPEPTERTSLVSDNPYANDPAVTEGIGAVPGTVRGNAGGDTSGKPPSKAKPGIKAKKSTGPGIVRPKGRTTQKMKILPESLDYERGNTDDVKELSLQQIKDKPARKDAARLGKKQRSMLPRVTAYCTAGSYRMRDLIRWLQDKKRVHSTSPKLFDECIYTPFAYKNWRQNTNWDMLHGMADVHGSSTEGETANASNIVRLDDEGGEIDLAKRSTDVFVFEYGVVVLWGFSKREEEIFLDDLERFENEKLSDEDVQSEEFNYYVTQSYRPRIYNDFISLRDDSNYMTKLSISYAVSQSVKISLFEELVDNTIEDTQEIPKQISETGKVEMTKDEIMKSIGELFILRININLHGAILDSPELMWSEPQLEPIYQATRGYLEINQRVSLLNQRLEVIADLLQMLKEQLTHNNDEQLELIVIVLISAEVMVSMVNIIVDLIAGR